MACVGACQRCAMFPPARDTSGRGLTPTCRPPTASRPLPLARMVTVLTRKREGRRCGRRGQLRARTRPPGKVNRRVAPEPSGPEPPRDGAGNPRRPVPRGGPHPAEPGTGIARLADAKGRWSGQLDIHCSCRHGADATNAAQRDGNPLATLVTPRFRTPLRRLAFRLLDGCTPSGSIGRTTTADEGWVCDDAADREHHQL